MKVLICFILLFASGCSHVKPLNAESVLAIEGRLVKIQLANDSLRTGTIITQSVTTLIVADSVSTDSVMIADIARITYEDGWIGARDGAFWGLVSPYIVAVVINFINGNVSDTFQGTETFNGLPGFILTGAVTGAILGSRITLEKEPVVK